MILNGNSIMVRLVVPFIGCIAAGLSTSAIAAEQSGCANSAVDADGAVHTAACSIPFSSLASEEAKKSYIENARAAQAATHGAIFPADLSVEQYAFKLRGMIDAMRKQTAQKMATLYPVVVTPERIGGVQTDVVTPRDGVSPSNRNRVLINLHGGAMFTGARYEGQVMSIPIASLGKIKVVTVDYRMAPESKFPAASEDVAAVYKALLKHYNPANIGIYGCSAGGSLTAQSLAWFQTHHLPKPGAAAVMCFGSPSLGGDSQYLPTMPPIFRDERFRKAAGLYISEVSPQDPMIDPMANNDVAAKFPPTLFVNSTRDPTVSSAVHNHLQLTRAGVDAELYVWDGLDHAFMYDPALPESREVYNIVVKFFERQLGRSRSGKMSQISEK